MSYSNPYTFWAQRRGDMFSLWGQRKGGPRTIKVLQACGLEWEEAAEGLVEYDPAFHLSQEMAEAMYQALGEALGRWTPEREFSMEVYRKEQSRVDKLIDALLAVHTPNFPFSTRTS